MATLTSVQELIEDCVTDSGVVNFKAIHIVLTILARKMRLLDRRVSIINAGNVVDANVSQVSISDISIHTATQRVKGIKGGASAGGGGGGGGLKGVTPGGITKERVLIVCYQTSTELDNTPTLMNRPMLPEGKRRVDKKIPGSAQTKLRSKCLLGELADDHASSSSGSTFAALTEDVLKSIVTVEEFSKLCNRVEVLQKTYGVELLNVDALKKTKQSQLSITDPKSTLQTSERLALIEKFIDELTKVLVGLAKDSRKGKKILAKMKLMEQQQSMRELEEKQSKMKYTDCFTHSVLSFHIQQMEDELTAEIDGRCKKAALIANGAIGSCHLIDTKLKEMKALEPKVDEVEDACDDYAQDVSAIDEEISRKMFLYTEDLTTMQYDLDTGLERLEQALQTTQGDPEACAELGYKLKLLKGELDDTYSMQINLGKKESYLANKLTYLKNQLDVLNLNKSDRDDIAEQLKQKVGIDQLNGLIANEQYTSVNRDFLTRVYDAYEHFNNKDNHWQRLLNKWMNVMSKKVETHQLESVRDDINKKTQLLMERAEFLLKAAEMERDPELYKQKHCNNPYCPSCGELFAIKGDFKLEKIPPFEPFSDLPFITEGQRHLFESAQILEEKTVEKKEVPLELPVIVLKSPSCIPGRPIPHPPRGKICPTICDLKSPSKHKQPVLDIVVKGNYNNYIPEKVGLPPVKVAKPCIPCNKPEKKEKLERPKLERPQVLRKRF